MRIVLIGILVSALASAQQPIAPVVKDVAEGLTIFWVVSGLDTDGQPIPDITTQVLWGTCNTADLTNAGAFQTVGSVGIFPDTVTSASFDAAGLGAGDWCLAALHIAPQSWVDAVDGRGASSVLSNLVWVRVTDPGAPPPIPPSNPAPPSGVIVTGGTSGIYEVSWVNSGVDTAGDAIAGLTTRVAWGTGNVGCTLPFGWLGETGTLVAGVSTAEVNLFSLGAGEWCIGAYHIAPQAWIDAVPGRGVDSVMSNLQAANQDTPPAAGAVTVGGSVYNLLKINDGLRWSVVGEVGPGITCDAQAAAALLSPTQLLELNVVPLADVTITTQIEILVTFGECQ